MSRPLKIRNTLEMIPDDDNDEKYCPFLQYDTGAKLPLEIQNPHHLRQYGAGTEVPIKSLLGHRSQAPPEVRLVFKIHGLTAIVLKSFRFFLPFLQSSWSWFIHLKRLISAYMQKAGDCGDISPQIFLDFPQNFRLRTRNQYCTQAIAWGSTILDGGSTIIDGGSTILDGSSTIFCRFSPFFIDFHDLRTFVAIYILSRFTHFFRNFFWPK